MGRRFGATDAMGDFVTEDARAALCRAWSTDDELSDPTSSARSERGLRAWGAERREIFEADEQMILSDDEFDPTRISAAGASHLDAWFSWCGAVTIVMLVGSDARKRARLQTRIDSFETIAEAADTVMWPEEVRVALRDAYLEITERLGDAHLRQKARHLGMFATGLALGPRRAPGLAPILWSVMDAHDVKSFRRYIMRGLTSRRASAARPLRRVLSELQPRFEVRDE